MLWGTTAPEATWTQQDSYSIVHLHPRHALHAGMISSKQLLDLQHMHLARAPALKPYEALLSSWHRRSASGTCGTTVNTRRCRGCLPRCCCQCCCDYRACLDSTAVAESACLACECCSPAVKCIPSCICECTPSQPAMCVRHPYPGPCKVSAYSFRPPGEVVLASSAAADHTRSIRAAAKPKDGESPAHPHLDTTQLEQALHRVPQHRFAQDMKRFLQQTLAQEGTSQEEQNKASMRVMWQLSGASQGMAQGIAADEEVYEQATDEVGEERVQESDTANDQQDSDWEDWPEDLKQKYTGIRATHYPVHPTLCSPRVNREVWDRRIKQVLAKWEPRVSSDGWTADRSHFDYLNYSKYLVYDAVQGRFTFCSEQTAFQPEKFGMHLVMSSALLLYRLCCLFSGIHIKAAGRNGYKVMWSAEVKHKATGEAMGFSEWKGAALVRVSNLEAPAEFETDMLELINLLYHPKFPHPYDGVVAGSVAEEQL